VPSWLAVILVISSLGIIASVLGLFRSRMWGLYVYLLSVYMWFLAYPLADTQLGTIHRVSGIVGSPLYQRSTIDPYDMTYILWSLVGAAVVTAVFTLP